MELLSTFLLKTQKMLVNKVKFTKPSKFQKILLKLQNYNSPTIEDLKPTFIGYLGAVRFYHRGKQTRPGQNVITPNGIAEIIEIVPPEKAVGKKKQYQYQVKLLDNVTMFFNENQLKYLVVYPTDFYDNKFPILLSFADYLYANPGGMTEGQYTFKITNNGYAMMTDHTKSLLEINKLLTKFPHGRRFLKVMRSHNYVITKKR